MACTQCEELAQTVNIRVPTDLKNVIAVAKAAIQDGIIEEIELSKWGGPFSLINADGPWDDIVGHRLGAAIANKNSN